MFKERQQKFHTDDVSHPDIGSACDWLKICSNQSEATQNWVVTPHQYEMFALVPQRSFRGKTVRDVAKCRLFSRFKIESGWGKGTIFAIFA